jgi:dipeptidyl-peptidase-4
VVELVHLPDHQVSRVMAANAQTIARVKELNVNKPEFVKADIGGGVTLDGWMIKPPNFDSSKRYPVLIYVYGEPAGQDRSRSLAVNALSLASMLAQHGYLVMSFDNRGTPAPRPCLAQNRLSKDWRGGGRGAGGCGPRGPELVLCGSKRIAIWGWSGGLNDPQPDVSLSGYLPVGNVGRSGY